MEGKKIIDIRTMEDVLRRLGFKEAYHEILCAWKVLNEFENNFNHNFHNAQLSRSAKLFGVDKDVWEG